jgi:hypothetical protein
MKNIWKVSFIVLSLLVIMFSSAQAQTYYFSLDQLAANIYINSDGTYSIDYVLVFTNDRSASPIDYIDVGIPNGNFNESSITAEVNDQPIQEISSSGYQGSGTGVALGLGGNAIKPGASGTVHVSIPNLKRVLFPDSQDSNYASMEFSQLYFGSKYMFGHTNMSISIHLPPGVKSQEPRWHSAPSGWQSEPTTSLDNEGRVTYTWQNPQAEGWSQYKFGASFPASYVPASAITRPSFLETLGLNPETLMGFTCCLGFAVLIFGSVYLTNRNAARRKLQYLPPKIAIEGHGIKRGLTAVEASILLEQPMDKIMTMILFAVIKKGASTVIKNDPLELQVTDPLPDGLQSYETQFLEAFKKTSALERRKGLQDTMIDLVKSVSAKMKGFSRRETLAYYQDIIQRAWAQVESAQTPEVKSEKYNEVMEWTMMDKEYDERTRRVFQGGPVFIPTWWGRFDPGYGRTVISHPGTPAMPTSTGGVPVSMPHLPGSDFAASMVKGVQNFSAGVIGSVKDFTAGVTKATNPIPEPPKYTSTRSGGSSGGSRSCACACACAGCACACAGGGR